LATHVERINRLQEDPTIGRKLIKIDDQLREVILTLCGSAKTMDVGLKTRCWMARNFVDFVTGTYIPTYLPLFSSNTQHSYRGVLCTLRNNALWKRVDRTASQ